nr:hypothetical protein 7 [Candidatus Aminicenantes bacterium]
MSDFREMVSTVFNEARSNKQTATLAHIYLYSLERFDLASSTASLSVVEKIKSDVIIHTVLAEVNPRAIDTSFDPSKAELSFNSFYQKQTTGPSLSKDILLWLINGDFTDPTQERCRQVCKQEGLVSLLAEDVSSAIESSSGQDFGKSRIVDKDWIYSETSKKIFGRELELKKHLGFLALAIKSKSHYLLTGQPGVGKSLFIRHLIKNVSEKWSHSQDPDLNSIQFLFVDRSDFLGSEKDSRNKMGDLYIYLTENPGIIPVFDGFEVLLNHSLSIHQHFIDYFGGVLNGASRTFILVSRTAQASQSDILRGIKPSVLAGIDKKTSLPVVKLYLEDRLADEKGPKMKVDGDIDSFCSELVKLGAERYPGRAFPDLGLHLVDSVLHRVQARMMFAETEEERSNLIRETDLREQIAEEQGLSIEVIGKNAEEFYHKLSIDLKKDVIGQDHVIDRICKVLTLQAEGPPRRLPRGRFLFVGPPGVGKTQLARSLSKHLGYGTESFFQYNMSDFGSDGDRWRFIGSPSGYEGHGQVRTIFDEVRESPSCVILLDEVDRAHPAIQDILLSILEGEGKDADNNIVHFSQAIFIMTTNQGQDAVVQAYESERESKGYKNIYDINELKILFEEGYEDDSQIVLRNELSNRYADEDLRKLLLEGVTDKSELEMKRFLMEKMNEVKSIAALSSKEGDQKEASLRIKGIQDYIGLRDLSERIDAEIKKTALDRAFLDRVDFVMPFFPLKEPYIIKEIMEMKLFQFGWEDCPIETKLKILKSALAEKESVRPLERLVLKFRSG